jgi:hypothetical protein
MCGKLHRIDGPAVVSNNCEIYYKHGRIHRKDGPAIIRKYICTNTEEYWLDGIRYNDNTFTTVYGREYDSDDDSYVDFYDYSDELYSDNDDDEDKLDSKQPLNILDLPIEILAIITTADLDTFLAALRAPGIGPRLCCEYVQNYAKRMFTTIERTAGATRYYLAGILHRDDGPAVVYIDGDYSYYRYGKRHREDGPAAFMNGITFYCKYGKFHRKDGPAVIRSNGSHHYYLNGVLCNKEEYIKLGGKI